MRKTKNYYQILEVPTNASVQIIKRAIRDLRLQDHSNDFSIVINNIEHVLIDSEQREIYDKSINLDLKDCVDYSKMHQFIPLEEQNDRTKEKMKAFFDFSNEKTSQANVMAENLRHSPYNRTRDDILLENAQLHFGYAMSRKNFFWLIILSLVLFAGAVAFKPLHAHYTANTQAREAVEILKKTRDGIINYIKTEKVFPTTLPEYMNPPLDAFYTLGVNKDEQIILTFNSNAAESLKFHFLVFHAQNTPNIGLTWYCSSSDNFPARYLPGACRTVSK